VVPVEIKSQRELGKKREKEGVSSTSSIRGERSQSVST
jgi:hypothetical protein